MLFYLKHQIYFLSKKFKSTKRTDIDEAKVISFLGVQTDRISESSYGNMSAHTQKKKKKIQLKAQN